MKVLYLPGPVRVLCVLFQGSQGYHKPALPVIAGHAVTQQSPDK
jgi:hypothetical protein